MCERERLCVDLQRDTDTDPHFLLPLKAAAQQLKNLVRTWIPPNIFMLHRIPLNNTLVWQVKYFSMWIYSEVICLFFFLSMSAVVTVQCLFFFIFYSTSQYTVFFCFFTLMTWQHYQNGTETWQPLHWYHQCSTRVCLCFCVIVMTLPYCLYGSFTSLSCWYDDFYYYFFYCIFLLLALLRQNTDCEMIPICVWFVYCFCFLSLGHIILSCW